MAYMFRVLAFSIALMFTGVVLFSSNGRFKATGVSILLGAQVADAAQKAKRKSLFRILFGRKKAKKKRVTSRKTRKRKTTRRSKRKSKKRNLARVIPLAVEKSADAQTVLVVGDFFASGMASGLQKAFASNPAIRVENRGKGLSGFIRTDIVNWPQALQPLVDEVKPAYIVAMVGSNDRQLMRENGQSLKKRTAKWDEAYSKRITAFASALKKTNVPFVWMGLPPVRFKTMNQDFLFFNELYRKASVEAGGEFIDVWDGFSNADGKYSASGPDVNGQIVVLRRKDGINLTKAGKRRLAFYIEDNIVKRLQGELPLTADVPLVDPVDTAVGGNPTAVYDPAKTGKTIVIRLNDPANDGANFLVGGDKAAKAAVFNKGNLPVVPLHEGKKTEQKSGQKIGRVDHFVWPANQNAPSFPPPAFVTSKR